MPNLTANIIREALAAWALDLVSDLIVDAQAIAGPLEPGELPPLPTVGIEWSTAYGITEYPDVSFDVDGSERWMIQTEEAELAFVWRSNDRDEADLLAHAFKSRSAIESSESNPDGNRVLHFFVNLDGQSYLAKLYELGTVEPPNPTDAGERSLYTQRIPASVIYPSVYLRDADLAEMNIGVTVNGTIYPKPSILILDETKF